jgi:hypothetical protein
MKERHVMTTTYHAILLAILTATLAQAVSAQPPGDRDPAASLKRADADGDGKVTRDEFIKSRTAESEAAFARLDADGNGTLDDREIGAAAERMRPGRRPEGQGPRRPDNAGAEGERPKRPDGERPRRPDGERPQPPDGERPPRPGAGPGGEEAFNRLDRDGDGSLSREEFAEGMARMRDSRQRNGSPPGGPGPAGRGERGPEQGFRRPPPQD